MSIGNSLSDDNRSRFASGLMVQAHVVGALTMRELHTRYGRENVGYLWLVLEPLMLASVISLMHFGEKTHYGSDISPVPFTVLGYTIFIIFRGIWNRAEGALEANLPLMYHKMVSVFDIMLSRAIIEVAGCIITLAILLGLCASLGLSDLPRRPLILIFAIGMMLWLSFALSLIVVGVTHDNRTLGRLVHPISYLMIPISGAFYMIKWLPDPFRDWMSWNPMAIIFEMARYGQFKSADDDYLAYGYVVGVCLILTYCGMISIRHVRRRIHLQ